MAQTGAIVVVYYLLWVGLLGFGCGAKRRGTEFDAELKTWDLDCAMVVFVFVLLIVDVCDLVERATADRRDLKSYRHRSIERTRNRMSRRALGVCKGLGALRNAVFAEGSM
jgi:hypothetical protein